MATVVHHVAVLTANVWVTVIAADPLLVIVWLTGLSLTVTTPVVQVLVRAVPVMSVQPIVTASVGDDPTAVTATSQLRRYCPVGKFAVVAMFVEAMVADTEPEL